MAKHRDKGFFFSFFAFSTFCVPADSVSANILHVTNACGLILMFTGVKPPSVIPLSHSHSRTQRQYAAQQQTSALRALHNADQRCLISFRRHA